MLASIDRYHSNLVEVADEAPDVAVFTALFFERIFSAQSKLCFGAPTSDNDRHVSPHS